MAIPFEHGGWGLTLEPALLGLLVAPSIAGGALALAAFLVFLVRTPLKVLLVDRHRHRSLERDRLAGRVVVAELVVLATMIVVALARAGVEWIVPFAAALPLFAIELWYDARSRSRRLVPELCGAIGISGAVAAIALAGGETYRLAIALWLVLAARAVASVPFARVQVLRLRATPPSTATSDIGGLAALVLAALAVTVDASVVLGAVAVAVVAVAQFLWSRGPARPAVVVGFSQLGFGLAVVLATAIGVAT
ncbi:MAG TPA: YwiC-like family protein [Acidimicrobiia bacterium]|nr:YwiC-like family protein [Acidimicrobiia bacterium]